MSRNLSLLVRLIVVLAAAAAVLALMGFGAGIPEAGVVVTLVLVGMTIAVRSHRASA